MKYIDIFFVTALLLGIVWIGLGGSVYGDTVCYIYDTDMSSANSFKSLLEANGIITELIPVSGIAATDFSICEVIIVGSDTGHLSLWGTPEAINAIRYSGLPAVGNGEGGYAFFGKFGLSIGHPNGQHETRGRSKGLYVVDPEHPVFNEPNDINIGPDGVLDLYTSSNSVQVFLETTPPDVTTLSRQLGWEVDDQINHLVVLEEERYMFWGFTASPDMMTQTGKDLYINAVSYLLANAPPIPASEQPQTTHVPDDYPTIQAAINAAGYGNVIYVGPGTYREKLILKDGVSIIGDSSETTQIEYSGNDYVVQASGVQNGELSGFTIVSMGIERSVIFLKDSSIIISGNVIKGSSNSGVEVVGRKAAPQIMDNEIRENTGWGIVLAEESRGIIAGNVVADNLSDGIAAVASTPLITNNVVRGNLNGIVVLDGVDPQISNNTIVSNREAGIWVFLDASPSIFYNIIVRNGMGGIDALGYQYGSNGQPIVLFNDVWRNSGTNYVGIDPPELDISADPLFIDFDNHDYGLQEGSPCRGAADDGGDLGAYSPLETTVELIPVNVWSELHSRLTSGLLTLKAAVGNSDIRDVMFQYSLDGETWHDIGSDSQAPYSVNWDTRGVPETVSKMWAKAVVTDSDGFTARNFTELLLRMKNLLDDQLMSLNDFEGHVLLINFWDTWCGPCISEMPDLVKLQNKYNSQKFSVIGMAFGRYGEAAVKETMRGLGVNYPVIIASGKIERDFEQAWGEAIEAIPTTYVVNRNGEIVSAMRGSRTMNVFENAILPLLAESYEPLELKITSTPVITGTTGADYTYRITTTGGDGGTLIHDLTTAPDGMDVDPETGIISWTPTATQAGNHDVTIQVTDASGSSDTQTFTITVAEEANMAPEITSTPVTTSTEGERYTYQVEAEDANNDTLTYSLTTGPDGMTMDEATGVIHWTPSGTQAGSHDIVITVSDGRDGSDTQSFAIDVEESINNPPVIISIPVTTGIKGEIYEYDVEATDADSDTLTYSLTAFPEGMVVDSSTGVISWTPSATQVGSHDVTVEVDDGRYGIDAQNFTIDIAEAANNAPVITSAPVTDGRLNDAYEYRVEATDADDDALTFSLATFPEGMTIDANTGMISWVPVIAQFGDNEVIVQVADGRDGVGTQSFTINVTGIKGDVNGNGRVQANDAIVSLRIASGLMEPDDYQKWAADMNGDGRIRANDSIAILRKASGLTAPDVGTRRQGDAGSYVIPR
jgi:parallel beta-helix repeat protein